MKTIHAALIASISVVAFAGVADAAQRNKNVPATEFYDLVPQSEMKFDYHTYDGKAPHKGFDPHGNGVHPPIGPITDQ